MPRAQVALAWVLRKPVVTAPIVGVDARTGTWTTRSPPLDLQLTADEIARLEEPYTPHAVVGFA